MGLPVQAKYIVPSVPVPSSLSKTKGDSTPSAASSTPRESKEKTSMASKSNAKSSSTTSSTATVKKHDDSRSIAKSDSSSSSSSSAKKQLARTSKTKSGSGRLARLTAYWAGEGDYYTGRGLSSTGVHLHQGHCAVDPRIIPYGSIVKIAGVGTYVAVDTGSAVISREAARETGHTSEERNALVVDLYFEHRRDGERFAANGPKFASITWQAPHTADNESKKSHDLYAADDGSDKAHNKDL